MPDTAPAPPPAAATAREVDALIVGSGFAGLAMAVRLRQAGMESFLILEKGDDVGGTWRDNRYPGAACDIPSHLYSLSFAPKSDWTRMYPRQKELHAYLRQVADRYGLRPRIRLRAAMRDAVWDEAALLWRVTTSAGEAIAARILISGIGALHHPAYPDLPGLANFAGPAFHSSEWDEGFDFRGKRVAVIGTGASAIQFVPQIAPEVERLHLFQRTPPWIMPKEDGPIDARRRRLFRFLPFYRRLVRARLFLIHEMRVLGFVRDPKLMRVAERMARRHMERQLSDPELRRKVTPDYTIGCKRVLISNDYYPALARENVELVTDPIAEVRAHSVVTRDGTERAVDAIVFGTGFRATEAFSRVSITGRGGVTLDEAWRDGAPTLWGIGVSGFPNFFMLLGPNTGLGHNSVVIMIEAQVRYVMNCLRRMRRRRLRAIEARPEAQAEFGRRLEERMRRTVWQAGGCRSWYQDRNGRNTTLWPGSVVEYWWRTRRAAPGDWRAVPAAVQTEPAVS